jgi:hypothetical protein
MGMSKTTLLSAIIALVAFAPASFANVAVAPANSATPVVSREAAQPRPAWCNQAGYQRRLQGGVLSDRQLSRCRVASAPVQVAKDQPVP